jgi:hypothetical protein
MIYFIKPSFYIRAECEGRCDQAVVANAVREWSEKELVTFLRKQIKNPKSKLGHTLISSKGFPTLELNVSNTVALLKEGK